MIGLEPGTSDVGSGHSTYKLSHNHSHKNVSLFMAQCLFKKWANPGLFLVYFLFFFKQTIQLLQQINVKKCHDHPVYSARIQTHDLPNVSLLP